jgi:glutamate carboxypeptidase
MESEHALRTARPAGVASGLTPADADAERVLAYLEGCRAEIVSFLEQLVRLESPSTRPERQAPVLECLTRGLSASGLRVSTLSGGSTGGHLYARASDRERGAPFQLLLGHCDTVWPIGTLASMPVHVDGDVLRGPGSFDMKGGLTIAIFALKAVRELELQPSVTPVVLFTSDEEIGSVESKRHILRLARRADRALVLEPALGLDGRLKTARKGVGRFTVRVLGKSAHGGLEPEAGASAIVELAYVIQALHGLADPDRGITVNVGTIEGGIRPNVVAPESRAEADVRVLSIADAREVEEAVHGLTATTPGTRLEIEGRVGRAPMERTERNQALWRDARTVGRRLGLELQEGLSGGASDGNFTSEHTATLDGLGAVGDGAHAEHEFVYLDSLVERAALLALVLLLPARSAGRRGSE